MSSDDEIEAAIPALGSCNARIGNGLCRRPPGHEGPHSTTVADAFRPPSMSTESRGYLTALAAADRRSEPPLGIDTSLEKALSVLAQEVLGLRRDLDELRELFRS